MAETWLIDARTLSTAPTGVGLYAYRHILRLLREQPQTKLILATDVVRSAELQGLVSRGLEVRVYGKRVYRSFSLLGYLRFLKRTTAEVKPGVFWQPNNLQPFRPAGVGRVIVTMHDVFALGPLGWKCLVWQLYYRLSFGRTLRNVTEIWYNSAETKQAVERADARAKELISRVVPPLTVVPDRESIVPADRERPYFLYLGNIEERKGADLLFAAYARYREAGGRFDLVLAGLPRNVPVPETEGIVPLGYVDEAMKFSLMCAAEALVVPSRQEGYGMQVAEALALGIRTLASDLSVFREIDREGRLHLLEGFSASDDETRVTLLTRALLAVGHETPDRAALA